MEHCMMKSMQIDHKYDNFYVVCCVSNPCRYKSRYNLYFQFKKHIVEELGVKNFITIEMSFGERKYVVTSSENPNDIQVHGETEVWLKENLWNLAAKRLPRTAEYIAFCDADIRFLNPNVIDETIHSLQHFDVVQMFESVMDLGARGEIRQVHKSFVSCYLSQYQKYFNNEKKSYLHSGHPGYTIAIRRKTLERLGGFIERAILGSADHHFWLAMIGRAIESLPGGVHPEYYKMIMDFETLALDVVKKNIGFVQGSLLHNFHGLKKKRKYQERWDVITKNSYDPTEDIYFNLHGVMELKNTDKNIKLRDDIRKYFRDRDEDEYTSGEYSDNHK